MMTSPPSRIMALSNDSRVRVRGLVEQACQDEVRRDLGAAADAIGEVRVGQFVEIGLGDVEDRLDVLVGQIVDRDDVAGGRMCFLRHGPALLAIHVRARSFERGRFRPGSNDNVAAMSIKTASICTVHSVSKAAHRPVHIAFRGTMPPSIWPRKAAVASSNVGYRKVLLALSAKRMLRGHYIAL